MTNDITLLTNNELNINISDLQGWIKIPVEDLTVNDIIKFGKNCWRHPKDKTFCTEYNLPNYCEDHTEIFNIMNGLTNEQMGNYSFYLFDEFMTLPKILKASCRNKAEAIYFALTVTLRNQIAREESLKEEKEKLKVILEEEEVELKTSYFTLGFDHPRMNVRGHSLINHKSLIKIEAVDPRGEMHKIFGDKWAFEYDTPEDAGIEKGYFPYGILDLSPALYEDTNPTLNA